MVQHGQADMVALPLYYPLHDPENEFFDYSYPLFEDRMMMVCAYRQPMNEHTTRDLMTMFTSVSSNLWWATMAGFLTFVLALKFGHWILGASRKYKSPLWMVTRAFLFEDNFPEDIPFHRIITITACSFLFFFGNYLLNSMSSDLTVYGKPEVIASYKDVLDRVDQGRNLTIIFAPGLPETQKFEEAPEGTIQHQLWRLRQLINYKDGVVGIAGKLLGPILRQESITIMRAVAVKPLTGAAFKFANRMGITDVNPLFSFDPSAKKYLNVMVMSKKSDPFIKRQITIM